MNHLFILYYLLKKHNLLCIGVIFHYSPSISNIQNKNRQFKKMLYVYANQNKNKLFFEHTYIHICILKMDK